MSEKEMELKERTKKKATVNGRLRRVGVEDVEAKWERRTRETHGGREMKPSAAYATSTLAKGLNRVHMQLAASQAIYGNQLPFALVRCPTPNRARNGDCVNTGQLLASFKAALLS
jgi:hypothetical protein